VFENIKPTHFLQPRLRDQMNTRIAVIIDTCN